MTLVPCPLVHHPGQQNELKALQLTKLSSIQQNSPRPRVAPSRLGSSALYHPALSIGDELAAL